MNFSANVNVGGALSSAAGAVSGAVSKPPFPLDPGEFWAEAIRTIYGPGHVLFGAALNGKFTDANGEPFDTGPMLAGLIFQIGVGSSSQDGGVPVIQIKLNLQDLKMLNFDAGIAIEYDTTKPGEDCTLVTLDPVKIFNKFVEFANPLNWPSLIEEFTSNPVSFYEKNVEIFYPAGINLSLNVTATIGGPGVAIVGFATKRALRNLDPIWIRCGNTPAFPPKNLGLSPSDPVVLVEQDDPNTVVARIETLETIWGHFFWGCEEKYCEAIVASTLTYDFVKDHVIKFLNPPAWP